MPSYQNTKEILGSDEATFNALVSNQLTEFNDDTITEIGNYAFYHKNNLQSIYLPKVKKIGSEAFRYNYNLKRIFIGIDNNEITNFNSSASFNDIGRAIIYVPDELVETYRTTGQWRYISHKIFGISDYPSVEWNETEISDTPEQIAYYVSIGSATSRYDIGQYKTIDLGSEGQIRMQIVGKNMRELANSTETAQLEWLAMDLLNTSKRMNPYREGEEGNWTQGTGGIGGMTYCELQNYLDTTIWDLVPEVWQNMIKETKVYTGMYDTTGTLVKDNLTIQKLRIPSYREMFGFNGYEDRGPVYNFAFPDNETRKKCKIGSSSPTLWWLRSASSAASFVYVISGGSSNITNANITYGVALGFST